MTGYNKQNIVEIVTEYYKQKIRKCKQITVNIDVEKHKREQLECNIINYRFS